jgi:hypothetical protein
MDMRYSLQQQQDESRAWVTDHTQRFLEDRLGVEFAPWHDVLVYSPDGHTRVTGVQGVTPNHAVDTARWQAGHASDVTYLGQADVDESELPVPDWWADAPADDDVDEQVDSR